MCIQVLVFWTVPPQVLLNVGRIDVTTPVTCQSQPRQSFYSGCRIFGQSVGFSGCVFYSVSGNKFRWFQPSSGQHYTKFKNTGYMQQTWNLCTQHV